MHILPILFCLTWGLTAASEFVPKVTRSVIGSSQNSRFPGLGGFTDSGILMLGFGNRLHISFDNGENWRIVDGIGGDVDWEITVDQFYEDRAFVTTRSEEIEEIYVTEDQGRSWQKVSKPSEVGKEYVCFIDTHPFNRSLLLLDCYGKEGPRKYFSVFYASNDSGESFRRIAELKRGDRCKFAASSKQSTLESDGIYCIQSVERSEGIEMQASNQNNIGLGETSFQQRPKFSRILFYTADLGRTKKLFDELKGFSVDEIFVFPHSIAVITSEGDTFRRNKLWISKGGPFRLAQLPEKVIIWNVKSFPGDDQGRLLLRAAKKDSGEHDRSVQLLASDSSGLNFSFWDPAPELTSEYVTLEPSRNLKGMLWGRWESGTEEKVNWLQKVLNLLKSYFSKEPHREILRELVSVTKGSFDNGKTWTNLKVVDPSGKHKRLFNCNIEDVEHCSFQESFTSLPEDGSTAGIILKSGIVGEAYDPNDSAIFKSGRKGPARFFGNEDDMTFISRDGGASWEIAFEFPTYATFLDFGNIIVTMPLESSRVFTKFLFSLDQGRTWEEYHFAEPIHHAHPFALLGRGLKAYMGFVIFDKESLEYIFYTVDFSKAFDGTPCTVNDCERWYLSNGNCIDGSKYSYDRRKPEAKCLMRKTFDMLELHEEKCV